MSISPLAGQTSADLEQQKDRLRFDLMGFASVARLEALAPPNLRPSTLADGMQTLIVLGRATFKGVTWSRHLRNKQLAGGQSHRILDQALLDMAGFLEGRGAVALPLPASALDFANRRPEDLTPAGQGSYLLRLGAVEAGLATWGLNMMVLTPAFGPRLILGGVLTDAVFPWGEARADELCLGLEACGRCAAICPEGAIPRRAPLGAPLTESRGLDERACLQSCQPFGPRVFAEFLAEVSASEDRDTFWQRVHNRTASDLYLEMNMMKEASITGCSQCQEVCPVGADYAAWQASPHRQRDLPIGAPRQTKDGYVEVKHVGPTERRKVTWQSRRHRPT